MNSSSQVIQDRHDGLDEATVRKLRSNEFPWTDGAVYLNNASTGPLPERTRRVLDDLTLKRMTPHHLDEQDIRDRLAETRSAVARLIGAHSDEIALAANTGYGINVAAQALPLVPGDRVIVSAGEFPTNVYPWLHLRHRGIEVDLVPTTPCGWPDEDAMVERLEDSRVRVLAVSWVQFSTGFRADLARLSRACRDAGCFLVVDGIQGVGQAPLNVADTPVDLLSCGGQKWLLSPWGSGFLYVRRELLDTIVPPIVGWMAFEGTDDFTRLTDYSGALRADGRRFEQVTMPYQDLLGMNESVKLLLELGLEEIEAWLRQVKQPLVDAASEGAIRIESPTDGEHESAIVSVRTSDTERSFRKLELANVACSFREGAIRLAPHCYNLPQEMDRVVSLLME
ncbi:MAG: aminotransferase class V-fold PLP-dependent enzyme [Gemmatimonadota bacterium]|nr:MAG: aminotransferase class V-fold PLP-dependent enzyme [Gemmatimonadota bacterium]